MRDRSCSIEKLPEDILLHILQSLSLIDALATRLVSRTWNNLWQKSCSQRLNLCFDLDNIIGVVDKPISEFNREMYPDLKYYRKRLTLANGLYMGMSSQIVEAFIKGVDMILQRRRGNEQDALLGLESLEIRFPLRRKHSYHIHKWISSTVTSVTKQLVLVFDIPSDLPNSSDFYKFPFDILLNQKNLSLEYLQLEFISTKLPQNFDGFTTLRTLKLNDTNLTQEDVHNLLIHCPLLEFFEIQECENLVALQVSSPLPHLKVLILRDCFHLRRIELWAENLSSFDYDAAARIDHFILRECYNLTKVALCSLRNIHGGSIRPLHNDFPFVTTLYLESSLKNLIGVVLRDNIFVHLKFLAIFVSVYPDERNLQCLSSLLNGFAPMLEELELHVFRIDSAKYYKKRIGHGQDHPHLQRVTFTGFTGESDETMLAKDFLTKARSLQIMTIDPLYKCYGHFDATEPMQYSTEIGKKCRKAYKLLCEVVPENTKLCLVGN